jgi:hypothetical protein
MKNIIYKPDGKLTKFAVYMTIAIIIAAIYFCILGPLALLQDKYFK